MSATRDSQQGLTFVYSNFYQLYRQGKFQAHAQRELAKGIVLKPHSVPTPAVADVRVMSEMDVEEMKRWSQFDGAAKKELMTQVRSLRDARKRLTFLMSEIDDILKRG